PAHRDLAAVSCRGFRGAGRCAPAVLVPDNLKAAVGPRLASRVATRGRGSDCEPDPAADPKRRGSLHAGARAARHHGIYPHTFGHQVTWKGRFSRRWRFKGPIRLSRLLTAPSLRKRPRSRARTD